MNVDSYPTSLTINNRYVVANLEKDHLGEGGIGIVYKAIDNQKSCVVALKILNNLVINDPWIKEKFAKEAQAILRIKHSGVVAGKEVGQLSDGRPYLVMEYIEGQSLREPVANNAQGLDLARCAQILKQLGQALTAIHEAGVYHRDLKPENIMLTFQAGEEQAKIIDFGIATVKESPDKNTQTTQQLAGTPFYMAPEHLMNGKVSAQTDIYALAVIAYEIITGRKPFYIKQLTDIADFMKFYELQENGVKVRPRQLRPDLPKEADNLILQALDFDPSKRPKTAAQFGDRLYKALTTSTPSPLTKATPRPTVNSYLKIVLVLAAVLGIGIGTSRFFRETNSNKINTPAPTTSPVILEEAKFNYAIELQEFREGKLQEPFSLTGIAIAFHDKDRLRFTLEAATSGYLYLLNEAPQPLNPTSLKYNIIFPAKDEANLLHKQETLSIPEKKTLGMRFQGAKGVEKMWMIWSQNPLPLLEAGRDLLNPEDGGVVKDSTQVNNIKQLLEKYSREQVVKVVENKRTKLTTVTSTENIVAVLIELDHK